MRWRIVGYGGEFCAELVRLREEMPRAPITPLMEMEYDWAFGAVDPYVWRDPWETRP